jgi:hypothetical protein
VSEPLCTGIQILQGLLAPAVASLAVWIVWRQQAINHEKHRLDLFDRRMAIFVALMKVLAKITAEVRADVEDIREIAVQDSHARFLFRSDVRDYIKQLQTHAIQMRIMNRKIREDDRTQPAFEKTIEAEEAELLWFVNQYEAGAKVFEPYLSMKHR